MNNDDVAPEVAPLSQKPNLSGDTDKHLYPGQIITTQGDTVENVVIVMKCETYDRNTIKAIVTEGIKRLKYRPSGKIFAKPNVVYAYKTDRLGGSAFTHPAFVGASLTALSKLKGVSRIDMGEKTAVDTPTRLCFAHAGYYKEIKKVNKASACPVKIFCIEEEPRTSVFIGGVVHDTLRIAKKMADADSMVYLPKLKCHCVSNMTGAVKLNVGVCSDDERSIRHDFMLNEKIVDLLTVGNPDLIIMDAIDVGLGNEAFPTTRRLGLILMGVNPIAVDLVAARLLGFGLEDVAYLEKAVERGYAPTSISEVLIAGDFTSLAEIDAHAKTIMPYDDEYKRWQDINRELKRLGSPMRFEWGAYGKHGRGKCLTGCVMGLKMFLGFMERYAGKEAFANAEPVIFVIGRCNEPIDAAGAKVFKLGSCANATITNAKKVIHINKCFTTASDMLMRISHQMGMPSPMRDPAFLIPYGWAFFCASLRKTVSLRYAQDIIHFLTNELIRKL